MDRDGSQVRAPQRATGKPSLGAYRAARADSVVGIPRLATRVCQCIGIALIASAWLKTDWSAKGGHDKLLRDGGVTISLCILEAAIGSGLIAGVGGRGIRIFCIALFFLFAVAAISNGVLRNPSCGCFGEIRIPPFGTAIFDVGSVAFFALVRHESMFPPRQRRYVFVAVLILSLAGIGCLDSRVQHGLVLSVKPQTQPAAEIGGNAGSLVLLEPSDWIGKPFVLAQYIDGDQRLNSGAWVVLLIHHDCDDCLATIPRYTAAAKAAGAGGPGLAIVEMPPYGDGSPESQPSDSGAIVYARLDTQRDWFAATPVAIWLVNGQVKAATESEAAEQPNPALWKAR